MVAVVATFIVQYPFDATPSLTLDTPADDSRVGTVDVKSVCVKNPIFVVVVVIVRIAVVLPTIVVQ